MQHAPAPKRMLGRAIHFDESDQRIFHQPARTGEWAISGGFEFSNWSEADLSGKARQAFTNGWLGIETFGRATFVAVTQIEEAEFERLADGLAEHFVTIYGAPTFEQAREVAVEELNQMVDLCSEQTPNTLLSVARELTDSGVNEIYRIIESPEAGLEQFAIHADYED